MHVVSRSQISVKVTTILRFSRRYLQSVRIQIESVLPESLARRSKIHYFVGKLCFAISKKVMFFGKIFLLPSQCTIGQYAARSITDGRGFDSP